MKHRSVIIPLLLATILTSGSDAAAMKIHSPALEAELDAMGNIAKMASPSTGQSKDVSAITLLAGCEAKEVQIEKKPDGALLVSKIWKAADGHTFPTVETYSATPEGIRWEITITDAAPAWSTEIETHLRYPSNPHVTWWTAWGHPQGANDWQDPLVAVPLRDSTYYYGAPPYTYENPQTAFCPVKGDLFCVPLVSVMDGEQGLSLALSPEDLLLDITLQTKSNGSFVFRRLNHRLGGGKTVKFSLDLVAHKADWRAALGWMARRYPANFDPVLPIADQIAGTGAYTRNWLDFDVEKMKKMAFMLNWKASHDFPYMGMFLPPVATDYQWRGFDRRGDEPLVSISRMTDYAAGMRKHGFHVLSYFNVTEFGTGIQYPAPPRKAASDEDLWKDPNDFLYAKLGDAILYAPEKQKPFVSPHYGQTDPNKPFKTWGNAAVMDPGEPIYQQHLLNQAKRHLIEIPDTSGICIDRMDWLRMYNHRRDDGVSWFGGQAVRSLHVSWKDLMEKLSPLFHEKGKVIYANNHTKRLEQLRYVDGIFDEFTYFGSALNTISLLGVRKPVMGWVVDENYYKPNPDLGMQKFLYLGVFPMAPFPANDHSLHPGPLVDKLYLDYGPLLKLMRGKKWVLEPDVIEVKDATAKANLFEVPGGWVVPVVFGKQSSSTILIQNPRIDASRIQVEAWHPGAEKPVVLSPEKINNRLSIHVPTQRGCAMVSIKWIAESP